MSDQQQEMDAAAGAGGPSPPSCSRPQHLNLDLQPDYLDDPSDPSTVLLPSFRDIRAKTLRALYGIQSGHHHPLRLFVDKSPKGSVDEAIRPLVDLINAHPSYATLSSCSGRIALFDPSGTAGSAVAEAGDSSEGVDDADAEPSTTERDNVTSSGKGSGRWALSSHGQIDPEQLIDILNDEPRNGTDAASAIIDAPPALMFKHEPLLLHVAASTLTRAEKLLSMALALGFRESGIVSTSKRATVAIRGVGLSLSVPLARRGPLRPSEDFVVALVGEANQRFVANEDKLQRLYELVERELFVPKTAGYRGDGVDLANSSANNNADMEEYEAIFEPLPKLGLWGHACAVVPTKLGCNVYALGGHGVGPNGNKSAARSNKIYRLEQKDNCWDTVKGWETIEMNVGPVPSQFETETINSIHMQHATLGAREGLAACVLPFPDGGSSSAETSALVAIFGGRAGPAHPSDELLLYEPFFNHTFVWKPTDVRGEPPAARWGHTFTALSGRNGRMAIVCGGRSTRGIVPTCHILNLVSMSDLSASTAIAAASHSHFVWETVNVEVGLFQHVSTRVFHNESSHDALIILGGNKDPANLFGSSQLTGGGFGGDVNDSHTSLPMMLTIDIEGNNHNLTKMSQDRLNPCAIGPLASIGSSGCSLYGASQDKSLFVVSGGVPSVAGVKSSALSLFRAKAEDSKRSLESIPVKCRLVDDNASGKIDVGSLVRHNCISLESGTPSLLLAGGGISSFAFGPSFAESYHISIQPIRNNAPRGSTYVQKGAAKVSATPLISGLTNAKASVTDVVYVEKPKAKELKNDLEKAQLLDKNYRMILADASSAPDATKFIAVPVSPAFAEMSPADVVSCSWFSLIAGRGRQAMPFSTKVLGNRRSTR